MSRLLARSACLCYLVSRFIYTFLFVLFGWVGCLFFVFVLAHFSHSNLHCLLLQKLLRSEFPHFAQLFVLSVCFLLLWNMWEYILVFSFLFCFLFSFLPFFLNILCCFASFCVLTTFSVTVYFAHYVVFSCFPLCTCIVDDMWCMGGNWAPLAPLNFPYMICDTHLPTSASLSSDSLPHTLAKIMFCGRICASVYLVLCSLGANASPYTHPNPSLPYCVPPYPFMSARIYVSFGGKFPGHAWSVITPY